MQEIDTALCLQKLSLSGSGTVLPAYIYLDIFTALAWDNIDRLEETVTGGVTSHRVNGIAVQARTINPVPVQPMPSVAKTKKRSIVSTLRMLPTYHPGQWVGPPQSKGADADTAANTQLAREKNLVWVLAHMS